MFYMVKLCGQQSGRGQTCQSQQFLLLWRSVNLSLCRVRRKEAPEAGPHMTVHSQRYREIFYQDFDILHQISLPNYSFSYSHEHPDSWSLFWPPIVLDAEIICNLIAHYKILLFPYLHSFKNKSIRQFCVPHIWQLFCLRQVGRPAHWLRNACGKRRGRRMGITSSATSIMNNSLRNVPLFVPVCIQVVGWQMLCLEPSLCSKDAAVGSFGELSLVCMGTLS